MPVVGARNADGSAVNLTKEQRAAMDAKKEARDIAASIEAIVSKHNMHSEALTDLVSAVLLLGERVTLLEQRQTPENYNDNSTH